MRAKKRTLPAKLRANAKGSLSLDQVRMILRIYWTDQYTRQKLGFTNGTYGIKHRLANQFGTTVEIIKKVVGIKQNAVGSRRRARYPSINLQTMKRNVKLRLTKIGILP